MATLIESWAGLGSNTYVDLTAADSIAISNLIDASAWTDATVPQRQASLLQATRDVDALNYIGVRYNYNQTLIFPRRFENNFPWGFTNSATVFGDIEQVRMKEHVQVATVMQAVSLLRSGGATGTNQHVENQRNGVQSWQESIGPLNVSVTTVAPAGRPAYSEIQNLGLPKRRFHY